MGRIARVVIAGMPHHVTQRGNRRQQTFFCDDDYRAYLQEMSQWCGRCGRGWSSGRRPKKPGRKPKDDKQGAK